MHFAVAPVGSALLAAVVGADLLAVAALAAVLDAAAGAAAGAVAADFAAAAGAAAVAADADLDFVAFCIPPWPLQVPLPVEVVVVPSLQVVLGAAAARLGIANAQTNRGAAIRAAIVVFFINFHSLVLVRVRMADCKPNLANAIAPQCLSFSGNMLTTSMTKRVCWPCATPSSTLPSTMTREPSSIRSGNSVTPTSCRSFAGRQ